MSRSGTADSGVTGSGAHFSCTLTAVMLAYINDFGGESAVARLLSESGVQRPPEYLLDIGNWVSYDEAVALWETGAAITRDPYFGRHLGETSAARLNASPVAALLRSLGSPEEAYRQMTVLATKYSVTTEQEVVEVRPGYAEIRFAMRAGFPRSQHHCAWTEGLLTQTPILFGLPPAKVEHRSCAALGADECRYYVTWDAELARDAAESSTQELALREQLDAMTARLQSMFATASDLIAEGDLDSTLAAITDRAALEVRAPRYLLAVQPEVGGEIRRHHKGLTDEQAALYAERAADPDADTPDSWLVVAVQSHRHAYGHLLAIYEDGATFLAQERELLEVYARYAATALDTATALVEAKRRHDQASTLLELARTLATAGTSDEVAQRLAEAVPMVVDCDRVGVYLWDEVAGELRRRAVGEHGDTVRELPEWSVGPDADAGDGQLREWLERPDQKPIYVDVYNGSEFLRESFAALGAVASVIMPIASSTKFLGTLAVSVVDRPERLRLTPDLRDRLSGVAAHAATALENGRLVDRITHQAHHDSLTGLANRAQLRLELARRTSGAPELAPPLNLFYLDLNGFKPINDEFGHEVGDQLLCAVGERLNAVMRGDDVVARLGGDEFAVLLVGVADPALVEMITQRLADVFDTPFAVGERRLRVGASIGRAAWPADARSIDELIRLADGAMYEAKREHHTTAPRAA